MSENVLTIIIIVLAGLLVIMSVIGYLDNTPDLKWKKKINCCREDVIRITPLMKELIFEDKKGNLTKIEEEYFLVLVKGENNNFHYEEVKVQDFEWKIVPGLKTAYREKIIEFEENDDLIGKIELTNYVYYLPEEITENYDKKLYQ